MKRSSTRKEWKESKKMHKNYDDAEGERQKKMVKWEPIKMDFEQMRAVSSEDVEKLVYIVRGCARDERQVVSPLPLSLSLSLSTQRRMRFRTFSFTL